jgi:hypothetical protein
MSTGFSAKYILYPGNDNLLNLFGLTDLLTNTFLDSATVTATLYDQYGNSDPGATNINMAYVTASNGNYQGLIIGTQFSPEPLPPNTKTMGGYKLVITAIQGPAQAIFTYLVDLAPRIQ